MLQVHNTPKGPDYRVGSVDSSSRTINWGASLPLSDGKEPSVAVTNDGVVIAVFNNMDGLLWQRVGQLKRTSFQARASFYFAEVYTVEVFREYLCLFNPNDRQATAYLTFYLADGETGSKEVAVPAESRVTVNLNEEV